MSMDPALHDAPALRQQLADSEQTIAALRQSARDTQRRQVEFLATVAHELTSPLMPLRLAALMLEGARDDEAAYTRHQATIKAQVGQISRLIGDLMEGSRISTGKFRLERSNVDLAGILRGVADSCAPTMRTRRQPFQCELPDTAVIVLGDELRLRQVFTNLLENSVKYTPEGRPIALHAAIRANTAIVTIADEGIGISAAALPLVFDMFARDAHASVSCEGLGIGLSIVRELVKAHEGSVTASSGGIGCGSKFVVALPLATVHRPARAAA